MIWWVSGHVDLENPIEAAQNVRLTRRIQSKQSEHILLIE